MPAIHTVPSPARRRRSPRHPSPTCGRGCPKGGERARFHPTPTATPARQKRPLPPCGHLLPPSGRRECGVHPPSPACRRRSPRHPLSHVWERVPEGRERARFHPAPPQTQPDKSALFRPAGTFSRQAGEGMAASARPLPPAGKDRRAIPSPTCGRGCPKGGRGPAFTPPHRRPNQTKVPSSALRAPSPAKREKGWLRPSSGHEKAPRTAAGSRGSCRRLTCR